ncbi:14-3-3 protein gamma-like [Tropilaelaps mercedesae]|uniref:14-3-3 protein gamma-like n=1 Tax=Tropilaelaps mercedesae TaxID=418985 RepID=A0A1V9X6H9_9ACAR|nr:14-3-3 protein gamma-like [Tropilaelaps mercedesae]
MSSMNLESLNRKELLDVAKLAEVAERYDDVASIMKNLWTRFKAERSFDAEERDQFIIGFKNAVTTRRTAWKNLNALMESGQWSAVEHQTILRAYMQVIENEIVVLCNDVLRIVDDLLGVADDVISRSIFLKTKADYFRYLAEVKADPERTLCVGVSHDAYKEAYDIARTHMAPTDPVALGIFLNYSMFCHEFLLDRSIGVEIAKNAFDEAVAELDAISEERHRDATLILKIIRENLELWRFQSGHL